MNQFLINNRFKSQEKTCGNLHSNKIFTYRNKDSGNKEIDDINVTYSDSENIWNIPSDSSNKYSSLNQINLLTNFNDASGKQEQQVFQPLLLNWKIPNTERSEVWQPIAKYSI